VNPQRTITLAPSVAPHSLRLPQPNKFSGEDNDEDIEDALFTFENYLRGTGVARENWPLAAMNLLDGKARSTWIAFAQPMQAEGKSPTWEQFCDTLTTAFALEDRQLSATSQLHTIKQAGRSVTDYLRAFRLLVAWSGVPPVDRDLLIFYWNGLNKSVQDDNKLDPTTGAYWVTFEALAKHTVTISTQRTPGHVPDSSSKPNKGFKGRGFSIKIPTPPLLH
jgi:hypothetical protein